MNPSLLKFRETFRRLYGQLSVHELIVNHELVKEIAALEKMIQTLEENYANCN